MMENLIRRKRRRSFRSTSIQGDNIPTEMWAEILARLPVKTILRFRCVSKTWCSIIHSRYFVSEHLKKCKTNRISAHLLIADINFKWAGKGCILRSCNTFRKSHQIELLPNMDKYHFEIKGQINGVLLMHFKNIKEGTSKVGKMALWNPSLRKAIDMPPSRTALHDLSTLSNFQVEICLGLDPLRNDYKVMLICYPPSFPNVAVWVEVYSFNTGFWHVNTMFHLRYRLSCNNKVVMNGFIYMTGYEGSRMQRFFLPHFDTQLISFDVAKETFTTDCLPKVKPEDHNENFGRTLTRIGESLALFEHGLERSNIYVMQRSNNGNVNWAKTYTLEQPILSFFMVEKKGLILFERSGVKGIMSYDTETHEVKHIAKTTAFNFMEYVGTYEESLVLLGHPCNNQQAVDYQLRL